MTQGQNLSLFLFCSAWWSVSLSLFRNAAAALEEGGSDQNAEWLMPIFRMTEHSTFSNLCCACNDWLACCYSPAMPHTSQLIVAATIHWREATKRINKLSTDKKKMQVTIHKCIRRYLVPNKILHWLCAYSIVYTQPKLCTFTLCMCTIKNVKDL